MDKLQLKGFVTKIISNTVISDKKYYFLKIFKLKK